MGDEGSGACLCTHIPVVHRTTRLVLPLGGLAVYQLHAVELQFVRIEITTWRCQFARGWVFIQIPWTFAVDDFDGIHEPEKISFTQDCVLSHLTGEGIPFGDHAPHKPSPSIH